MGTRCTAQAMLPAAAATAPAHATGTDGATRRSRARRVDSRGTDTSRVLMSQESRTGGDRRGIDTRKDAAPQERDRTTYRGRDTTRTRRSPMRAPILPEALRG